MMTSNYLTNFFVYIKKHVDDTYTFTNTVSLSPSTVKDKVNEMLEKNIPIPQKSFDWFRTIVKYVCDKGIWLQFNISTGLWYNVGEKSPLDAILGDYFQYIYDEAVKVGDKVHMGYASFWFSNANKISALIKKLSTGIQFKIDHATEIVDRTFGLRYIPVYSGDGMNSHNCLVDINEGVTAFNSRIVRPSEVQDLLLTQRAPQPIDLDESHEPKLWLQLIDEYMLHDPVKVSYFYDVLGYMMSPYNANQAVIYWYGPEGRNGKSTLLKVLRDILGDAYVADIKSEFLYSRPPVGYKADDTLAGTEGRSLYVVNELDERQDMSTKHLKDLTEGGIDDSGNRLPTPIRPSYSKQYNICVSGIPLIVANNLIRMNEYANLAPIFKRLILVRFDYIIKKEDPTIPSRLAKEYPQIQRWLYANYFRFKAKCKATGHTIKTLPKPLEWGEQTKEYMEDTNTIQQFWDECITVTPNDRLAQPNLYKMYKTYCEFIGKRPIAQKGSDGFDKKIKPYTAGYATKKSTHGTIFVYGISASDNYNDVYATPYKTR